MIRNVVSIFLCLLLSESGISQSIKENALDFGFSFGFETPLADLKDRFGTMYGGDFSLNYYTGSKGSQFGIKLGFLTSDAVREDVFAPYRTEKGQLLSQDGVPTAVNSRMAASYVGVDFNQNLMNLGKNEHAKVFIGLGTGFMQHKIRFIEFTQTVPLAVENYAKGHDRNSRGLYIEEQLGIKVRKNQKKYDLSLFSFQGFLKPVRAIQFDTGIKNTDTRLDVAIGIKFRWYISLSASEKGKDIYY